MTMKTVKYYPWCSKFNATISTPKEEWIPFKRHERFLYHLTYRGSLYPHKERLFLQPPLWCGLWVA